MIYLVLDIRNDNVSLTCFELTTISGATYLFEFENTQTKEKKYFIAPDTSSYPMSYNKFSIKAISTGTPNQLTGEFLCEHTDFWHYKVYEQVSTTNLDPLQSGAVVENGIVRVDVARPEIATPTESQTIAVYGN